MIKPDHSLRCFFLHLATAVTVRRSLSFFVSFGFTVLFLLGFVVTDAIGNFALLEDY